MELLDAPDDVARHGVREVVVGIGRAADDLAVEVARGVEVAERLTADLAERADETALRRERRGLPAPRRHVPLAGDGGAVAGAGQRLGERHAGVVQVALVRGRAVVAGVEPDTGLRRVEAGQQRASRDGAPGVVVHAGEAPALGRDLVDVRRRDLRPPAAEVRVAHVVGKDHDDVGAVADGDRIGRRSGVRGGRRGRGPGRFRRLTRRQRERCRHGSTRLEHPSPGDLCHRVVLPVVSLCPRSWTGLSGERSRRTYGDTRCKCVVRVGGSRDSCGATRPAATLVVPSAYVSPQRRPVRSTAGRGVSSGLHSGGSPCSWAAGTNRASRAALQPPEGAVRRRAGPRPAARADARARRR